MEYIINSLKTVNVIQIILIVTIGPIVSYFIQQWLKNLKTPIKAEFVFKTFFFSKLRVNGDLFGCNITNITSGNIELSRKYCFDMFVVDERHQTYERYQAYVLIDGEVTMVWDTFTLPANKTALVFLQGHIKGLYVDIPSKGPLDTYHLNARYICEVMFCKMSDKEIRKYKSKIIFGHLGKKRKCKIKFPKTEQDKVINFIENIIYEKSTKQELMKI